MEGFKNIAEKVLIQLVRYIEKSNKGIGKVLVQKKPEEIATDMQLEHYIRKGKISEDNIEKLLQVYLSNTQHMHHPAYIGHQVAVPHPISGLADMIHGLVNNPMAIYEMGPAAAAIEKVVVNWMLEKIGWFKADSIYESDDTKIQGGGVLTHGGSLANLTAMLAARARVESDIWTDGIEESLYVLAPEMSHYSIARAVSIMGLGSKNLIPIPVNSREQVDPEKLYNRLHILRKQGKKVMAVTANACATSTGLYDPIDEIADICNTHGVWFHIDGAHGAGALLTKDYKHYMKGVEKADSIIWDAHKMLRTSALSAAVLFRNHEDLDNTFRQKGSYIFFEKEKLGYDFMYNTIECTKSALGTKIFWALAADGEQGIADYISTTYKNTLSFYELIQSQEDFECPCEPQSNILCFKYTGKNIDDEKQLRIRNELVMKGDFYITTTTIKGKRYQRLTVMNPLTGTEHIEKLLDAIREIV